MVRRHIADYRAAFHLPEVTTLVNVDLSTVSASTDIVLADANPPKMCLARLDFQSGHNDFIDDRILMYQGMLRHRYHLPAHSVVPFLRPHAYRPPMTGGVLYETSSGRGKINFKYEMIQVWEIPVTELLAAGIGAAGLAVLVKLPQRRELETEIADVLRELSRRLRTEVQAVEAKDLMASATVFTGLRIPIETARALVERVQAMEESTVFQVILEKGEACGFVEGARKALLAAATRAMGRPSKKARASLEKINDVDRLVRISAAVQDVKTWNELLTIE